MFSYSKFLKTISRINVVQINRSCSIFHKIPFNYEFLTDPDNTKEIENAIFEKQCNANINKIINIYKKIKNTELTKQEKKRLFQELEDNAMKVPNLYNPKLISNVPIVLETINKIPTFQFKTKDYPDLLADYGLIVTDKAFSWFNGKGSYSLYDDGALFEKALLRYTLSNLTQKGFTLLSVPEIIYADYIEKAGMPTKSERSQVYHLNNNDDLCLVGTGEHSICSYLADKIFDIEELPLKFIALSRCYREEVGNNAKDKGFYRLNQFSKVEMFGVTSNETGEESSELFNELVEIQKELFSSLGLHLQTLQLPPQDLCPSAYHKIDIEAWMPFRKYFGEISSASNCTDYQSRRLNIRYRNSDGELRFTHTINGTGCALPRLMMSLFLTYQRENQIDIPEVLRPFMGNRDAILPNKSRISLKICKR